MEAEPYVDYDQEADALYVTLSQADVEETVELDDLRLIDYGPGHAVVGIEFLGASNGIDLTDVPFARVIEQVLGASELPLRVVA